MIRAPLVLGTVASGLPMDGKPDKSLAGLWDHVRFIGTYKPGKIGANSKLAHPEYLRNPFLRVFVLVVERLD
jgi:hypothetical protein